MIKVESQRKKKPSGKWSKNIFGLTANIFYSSNNKQAFWNVPPERFLLYPIGERSLLAAMEILIDELLDLLGVVLDILAERLVIEGLQLGDDAVDHGR